MDRLSARTLVGLVVELAAHGWREDEIAELVDPKLGIITGFQELLDELERLRAIDLGRTAPAGGVTRQSPAQEDPEA